MNLETWCFEKGGPQNTDRTLAVATVRAQALGLRQMVVASSHGGTARKAQTLCAPLGISVVAVTISHGWESQGWCMTPAERKGLEALGVRVVTGTHALGDGVGSAFSAKYGGRAADEIVRDTLYRFCQGMKVAVESVLMAADAGALDMSQEVVAVAGSSEGADTAIVVKPAYPNTFLDLEIREVLAKPRNA
ncbi:MAG: pyruvate kinase alpha/beta domain-containing protein [Anaerolineae bacterium]